MWHSVRFRITAIAAAALVVVLAGAGVAILAVQQRELVDTVDRSLVARADVVGALDLSAATGAAPAVFRNDAGADGVVQLVAADATVVAGTPNALELDPIGPSADVLARDGGESITTVATLPIEDDRYRVLSRLLDDGRVLHVAENVDDLDGLIAELRLIVLVAGLVSVTALTGVVWWLVGRTLRPVDAMRAEVASISGGDLDRRVPEPATDDEIARLAATMNEMLGRLQDASERQRRFVADASHELRSPLARMRAELETAPDGPAARASAIDEIDAMAALVDDLLVLARADSGELVLQGRPLDLDDIVLDEIRFARARAADAVVIDASSVSAAHVVGDGPQLRRVVRNLLDNAVRHARSSVVVSLGETAGGGSNRRVRLVVSDDGPGIPPDATEAVFERFARLDTARAVATGGAGLGLAIAREIVERHGGSIRVDTSVRPARERGARLVVELPVG